MALDHDHCFLCAVLLDAENRTDEHVFARWLQRDFDLWNQTIRLLNASSIRYRSLTIPCCRDCNGFWLSKIEDVVAAAFRAGGTAVEELDPIVLSLWMAKIYYGLHFKELALPMDLRNQKVGTIVHRDQLSRMTELHQVLQVARGRVRLSRAPASIIVLRAQVPAEARDQFDYRDARRAPFLAIRIGETVVLGCLLDWGAMSALDDEVLCVARSLELHPVQFIEVAAYASYLACRYTGRFGYLTEPCGDYDRIEPVQVRSRRAGASLFKPFDREVFGHHLAEAMGFELDEVYVPEEDFLWTNLVMPDGTPLVLTLEQAPIGVRVVPPTWPLRHPEEFVSSASAD
jgi:hypothetical protein